MSGRIYSTNHAACRYCERVNGGSGAFARAQLEKLAQVAEPVESGPGGAELKRAGDLYLVLKRRRVVTCFFAPAGRRPRLKAMREQLSAA